MTSDVRTAFVGVDLVIMLAKLDRRADDDHHERLKNIVSISRQHGAAIDKYAKKTVKVTDFPRHIVVDFDCLTYDVNEYGPIYEC